MIKVLNKETVKNDIRIIQQPKISATSVKTGLWGNSNWDEVLGDD